MLFSQNIFQDRKFFVFPHCAKYSQIISVGYIIKAIPYLTLPSLLQLAMAFLREKKMYIREKKGEKNIRKFPGFALHTEQRPLLHIFCFL